VCSCGASIQRIAVIFPYSPPPPPVLNVFFDNLYTLFAKKCVKLAALCYGVAIAPIVTAELGFKISCSILTGRVLLFYLLLVLIVSLGVAGMINNSLYAKENHRVEGILLENHFRQFFKTRDSKISIPNFRISDFSLILLDIEDGWVNMEVEA
jgi:hypothetical protein